MTDRNISLSVPKIIEAFGLERHHSAGWFAPHYGDGELRGRPRFSSIYHLLVGDEPLPLYKSDAVEVWHYYLGAPAEITVTDNRGLAETTILGVDLAQGQRPQLAVPPHVFHSCRSLGDWTLFGCTMAPGYSRRAIYIFDADD